MDFQAIQNEVGAQLRYDVSVAANLTLVKRWINRAQQRVCSRHDWSWLQAREVVQTAPGKIAFRFSEVTWAMGAVERVTSFLQSADDVISAEDDRNEG